jgi:hypothetical protein
MRSTGSLSVAGGFRNGLMKTINGAGCRSGPVFCSGSVWEVSLYKQRGGLENDAGLGSAEKDKRLAEIHDQGAA